MKNLFYLFILLFAFGCTDYNKVLKSTDPEYKFQKAVEYYNDGECFKAQPLLEELIGITRGTTRSEDVYYYYANVHFCLKQYYLANYYYKTFVKTFPNSVHAEEALFLAAMSNYRNSPNYSVDQEETKGAINDFQLFLDRYPHSELKDSTNKMVFQLRDKLERKDYEIAALYHKTEHYKAAVIALDKFIKQYPGSKRREKSMFLIADSRFKYAKNSILTKQRERYEQCKTDCQNYINNYPNGIFLDKVNRIYKEIDKEIENSYFTEANYNFKSGNYATAYQKLKAYIQNYQQGKYREKAMYLAVKSSFLAAKSQTTEKKKQSFENCIESYLNFADTFSSSKLLTKAEKYYLESKNKLQKIS